MEIFPETIPDAKFHSALGREHAVEFAGIYRTEFTSLAAVQRTTAEERALYAQTIVRPAFRYLYGPLTYRMLGSPQQGEEFSLDWDAARLRSGAIEIPYRYRGTWILHRQFRENSSFTLPVPYNPALLNTRNWRRCTDADPDHQTLNFYWYFWDPSRPGCAHTLGTEYQNVHVQVGAGTLNTTNTAPEYARLLESTGVPNHLTLTIGFGYADDALFPDPETDYDAGVAEYRKFLTRVRALTNANFHESVILQSEYPEATNPHLVIGRRFHGMRHGAEVEIKVVVAAGIDQMVVFAKSFAHDHDSVFAWMGHSRVGSGFDANRFLRIVAAAPNYYSITPRYQLIYWGGCNSYSYYTLPFFQIKAAVAGESDPLGTRGLDILVHGMPSYFSLNSVQAEVVLDAVLHWPARVTYQNIIERMEANASRLRIYVLAAVLGDEDNEPR